MYNILDLFCGAGGLSYGLDQVPGFKTVIGLDFNLSAIKTFSGMFPHARGLVGDITLPQVQQQIVNLSRQLHVNMIVGGPPCQGFSLKGKNLGLKDPRNFLFKEYLKFVEQLQPEIFIIENVKNILNSSDGYFGREIKQEIENLGYIVNAGVLNAKDYGVPQSRQRAFFIASKIKYIHFPQPHKMLVTVRDAISDLSYLESGEGTEISDYKLPPQSAYQAQLRANKLQYHMATKHSEIALKKLKMIPPEQGKEYLPKELYGKQKFGTTWSRLSWDDVSPTIDTRFDTPSNGRNSHPYLNRAITPREAARLQSFDDSFIFQGSKCEVCKQIGNAVPPLLAKAIGKQIILDMKEKSKKKENYEIVNDNAYTIIDQFLKEKKIVNHIITDPPYNISKDNNFSTLSNRQGVDFGDWDKGFKLLDWIPKYTRILDKNGSIIIFCSYRFISDIIVKLEHCDILIKDIIVWRKTNPMPRNIERRYVQDMEFAVWGVKKGAKWTFNKDTNIPYLRSLYQTATVSGRERTIHPTQKSLKLMEEIIKVHTNPTDLILDPFMGSGTTGVAALNLGRRFLGVEYNTTYFELAERRLADTTFFLKP